MNAWLWAALVAFLCAVLAAWWFFTRPQTVDDYGPVILGVSSAAGLVVLALILLVVGLLTR